MIDDTENKGEIIMFDKILEAGLITNQPQPIGAVKEKIRDKLKWTYQQIDRRIAVIPYSQKSINGNDFTVPSEGEFGIYKIQISKSAWISTNRQSLIDLWEKSH